MARLVKVASVLFKSEHLRGQPGAREAVLREVDSNFDAIRGMGVDLVVFSEGVESLGQGMDEAESVERPGVLLRAYQRFAESEGCTVAGSIKIAEGSRVYNSIVYVGGDGGVLGTYHKTFLTQPELSRGLSPGPGAVVVETPAGRLGGAICFDLNFQGLAEQYAPLRPDIMTFASMYHGGLMQGLWAYRCRSYFVSALPFHGGGILNPFGEALALTDCYTSVATTTVNLDRAMVHLDFNRQKFPDILRKYRDRIDLHVPANVGSALLTSRCDDVSAMDVVEEYELELLDDYLSRSQDANEAAALVGAEG